MSLRPENPAKNETGRYSMNRSTVVLFVATGLVFAAPAFAQRSHPSPGGGPPAGAGGSASSRGPGMNGAHEPGATGNGDMSHASPGTVLSQNPVMADKIKGLTGQEATTACNGFKNF